VDTWWISVKERRMMILSLKQPNYIPDNFIQPNEIAISERVNSLFSSKLLTKQIHMNHRTPCTTENSSSFS
jgi:hypothetical protein